MWRDEVGITEMLLVYISEFTVFNGWSSWRDVVVDILSCHEEMRRRRIVAVCEESIDTNESEFHDLTVMEDDPEITNIEPISSIEGGCVTQATDKHYFVQKESTSSGSVEKVADLTVKMKQEPEIHQFQNEGIISNKFYAAETHNFGEESANLVASDVSKSKEMDDVKELRGLDSTGVLGTSTLNDRTFQNESDTSSLPSISSSSAVTTMKGLRKSRGYGKYQQKFTCSFCSKVMSCVSQKIIHERIHTCEKPYKCRYCSKCFSQKGNRLSHERIHTGERPFKCSYCEKSFIQKIQRDGHQRTHMNNVIF